MPEVTTVNGLRDYVEELRRFGTIDDALANEFRLKIDCLPPLGGIDPTNVHWRHKERGTAYTIVGRGLAQASRKPIEDMADVVAYRGEDGRLWFRRVDEFNDGRFECIPGRCEICGWPLAESREKGCVQGNCSYRPEDPAEQRKLRERREEIAMAKGPGPELARRASRFQAGTKRIYESPETKGDMWYFELWHFLGDVIKVLGDLRPAPAEATREALRPFAEYAIQQAGAWGQHDDCVFYGIKRPGAKQVTYGDWRRAARIFDPTAWGETSPPDWKQDQAETSRLPRTGYGTAHDPSDQSSEEAARVTPAPVSVTAETAAAAWKAIAEQRQRENVLLSQTVDVLESNARVQARLLADTGRERAALRTQVEAVALAFAPFLSIGDQAMPEMVKIIHKDMDGLTPVAVTVTKDQFRAAFAAHRTLSSTQAEGAR